MGGEIHRMLHLHTNSFGTITAINQAIEALGVNVNGESSPPGQAHACMHVCTRSHSRAHTIHARACTEAGQTAREHAQAQARAHLCSLAGRSSCDAMPAQLPVVPRHTVACGGGRCRREGAIVDGLDESATGSCGSCDGAFAAGQVFKTNEDYGYVVLDVERRKAYELKRALEAVPSTIWVRRAPC